MQPAFYQLCLQSQLLLLELQTEQQLHMHLCLLDHRLYKAMFPASALHA